jgi:hypothetical protein
MSDDDSKVVPFRTAAVAKSTVIAPPAFVDFDGRGPNAAPARTFANTCIGLRAFRDAHRLDWFHDVFADEMYMPGIPGYRGVTLEDASIGYLRELLRREFMFDPGAQETWNAAVKVCSEAPRHPIKEFLQRCHAESDEWERVDPSCLLIDYFGAEDTPLNRALGVVALVASVKRIFEPGCKHDLMIVLEGSQGIGKSSGISALYGAKYYTDHGVLGADAKSVAETQLGMWAIEVPEMSHHRSADVDVIKAQLSRSVDRVRPAYGRKTITRGRTAVMWGTTNKEFYLQDTAGNRRTASVRCQGRVNLEKLARDRALIWAGAYEAFRSGVDHVLPEALWPEAAAQQEARMEQHPWADDIANIADTARHHAKQGEAAVYTIVSDDDGNPFECVASKFILNTALRVPISMQRPAHWTKVADLMRAAGWSGPKVTRFDDDTTHRAYQRPVSADAVPMAALASDAARGTAGDFV